MKKSYDVIVIGGGPGGFSAAISSAMRGVRTLLVERYGFLGGMATAGLVNPFMSYKLKGKNLSSSVFNNLIARLEKEGALKEDKHTFDDEVMKFVLDRMAYEYGVEVLFHSFFVDVDCSERNIKAVYLEGKSGKLKLEGKIIIDSTGDGDVACKAGAQVKIGREQDGLCQPMTLCFRIGGITGGLKPHELAKELTEILLRAKERGEINQPRENVLIFSTLLPDVYHFNTTRVVAKSGVDVYQLSEAEIEGRRQVVELFKLFKQNSPRFKNAYLMKMACQIGVRETRRILGQYILTEEDIIEARKFEDGIARSNYPIDIHNPTGEGTIIKEVKNGDYYEIPYRCLLPIGFDNLLIGSRCISSTHEAHSSLRVMPVVSGIEEAAGAAAAITTLKKTSPSNIEGNYLKKVILGERDLYVI